MSEPLRERVVDPMADPGSGDQVSTETLVYARVIQIGSFLALIMLVIGFILYVFGLLSPVIPVTRLPELWHLRTDEFVRSTGVPTGWGWLAHIGNGDYVNYFGISLLSALTLIGYLALLPKYIKGKEFIYAGFVLAEIAVLFLAASDIFGPSH